MSTVCIDKKEIELIRGYDVIVVGGGTAGAFAGISAARQGLKAIIIEELGGLGGSATASLVTPVMSSCIPNNTAHCSIARELNIKLIDINASDDKHYFDPTMLQIVLEELALESGCELLYHSTLIDVKRSGSDIEYVVIHNKDGLKAYKASYYIDATGDAILADLCGTSYTVGNKDGVNQPVSLRFEMANIDFEKFQKFMTDLGYKGREKYFAHNTPGMREVIDKAYEDNILTKQDSIYFQAFGMPGKHSSMNFNCPELTTKSNIVDAKFLTQKQIEGRRAILRISKFLSLRIPGFENAYITHIAQMVGIRESRRINAEYMLTATDILSYKKFDDAVVDSNYPVDIHGLDDYTAGVSYDKKVPQNERFWQIPFRVMLPIETDNLLVAGRSSGFDFIAQSAARVQHSVRAMGEAAGIGVSIAKKENKKIKDIDFSKINEAMRTNGDKI